MYCSICDLQAEINRAREEEGVAGLGPVHYSFKCNGDVLPLTQEQLTQIDSESKAFRKAARRLAERN